MEPLKHECGIAQVRLLKPIEYYQQEHGTWRHGLNKLYLLMEKQHNRGQDGAGIVCLKTDSPVGNEYIFRERAMGSSAITQIFNRHYTCHRMKTINKLLKIHALSLTKIIFLNFNMRDINFQIYRHSDEHKPSSRHCEEPEGRRGNPFTLYD